MAREAEGSAIVNKAEEIKFSECPPGLFTCKGGLFFKSEYGDDAYCVTTGEMFWGGTQNREDRAKLPVYPIEYEIVEAALSEQSKRENGCEYCGRGAHSSFGAFKCSGDTYNTLYITPASTLVCETHTARDHRVIKKEEFATVSIRFCPKCGHRLREAYARTLIICDGLEPGGEEHHD
jgi:hypothetical protein